MEEALRSSEERYQSLMNSSLSGIMSLQTVRNAAGDIEDFSWTTVNEAACQIIPLFHPGIIGKKSREVIPEDENDYLLNICKQVAESGQPLDREVLIRSPRVGERWLQISVVQLKDGVAVTFMDISERKENERELQKLSLVASRTSNAVIITNAKEEIEWVNESFTKISGYTLEEVQGKLPSSFLQGAGTDQQTLDRVRAKIEAQQTFSEEVLNYHKNGTPYWISMSITPILDKLGHVSRFISVESDITQRIKTDQELKAAKEAAEAATRAKSEFLATMSHEIRTPMNAVIGLTSLLVETDLTKSQRDYVETVRISGDNLLTIINDILDYSKIEAGKLELEQQAFCLQERIEVILDLLKERGQRKGLRLSLEIDPAVPAYLISDPTRIGQILMNLIGNAIKFTESGGVSLSVSLHKTEETGQIQKYLYFEVRDTGIGIPPEKLDRLFQSFSQVDASTTRKYGGTGLGLVISKNLINLMDGKIWVKSETGKGSRFCFLLPLTVPGDDAIAEIQKKGQSMLGAEQPESSWPTDLNVLLVEDNVINQKVATRSLSKLGLNADVAGNGLEALKALEIKDYDLIFMDMQMPEMDGLTATREIRKLIPDQPQNPLIIAMTANAMQGDRQRCLDAGMNDYLSKPIKLDDIRVVLRRWYQKQTSLPVE
jgi:PAS domain S-box-containing protein